MRGAPQPGRPRRKGAGLQLASSHIIAGTQGACYGGGIPCVLLEFQDSTAMLCILSSICNCGLIPSVLTEEGSL